jgi:hypothetical protein
VRPLGSHYVLFSQDSVHLPPRDAELPSDLGRSMAFASQAVHGIAVDAPLAARVDAGALRLGDALRLPLTPEVRLELGENAQHVEERLARRSSCINRLLGRLERDALLLQLVHDILKIAHGASQPVDTRDDNGIALVRDLEQELPWWPLPVVTESSARCRDKLMQGPPSQAQSFCSGMPAAVLKCC